MPTGQFISGCVAIYIACTLAAAAGIGGGALNLPILLSVYNYEYDEAVVLSLCTVLGNAFSQVIVNFYKRHPLDPRRPLIYWDMAMLFLPAQLCGNSVGLILSKILPTSALLILAVIVTGFAMYMTFRKGLYVFRLESEALAAAAEKAQAASGKETILDSSSDGDAAAVASDEASSQQQNGSVAASDDVEMAALSFDSTGSQLFEGSTGSPTPPPSSLLLPQKSSASAALTTKLTREASETQREQPTVIVLEQVDAATGKLQMVRVASSAQDHEEEEGPGAGRGAGRSSSSEHHHVGSTAMTTQVTDVSAADLEKCSAHQHQHEREVEIQSQKGHAHDAGPLGAVTHWLVGGVKHVYIGLGLSSSEEKGGGAADALPPMTVPFHVIAVIAFTLGFFLTIKSLMSEVLTLCTVSYWATFAVSFPVMAALIGFAVQTIATRQRTFPATILKGDVLFVNQAAAGGDSSSGGGGGSGSAASSTFNWGMFTRPAFAFAIGVVSRLLGIGGGELFGPFLLNLKIIPQVSTGTTSVLSFVSSLYNIVSRIITGEIHYGPAGVVFFLGMAGGATGRLSALRVTQLVGRPSVLIFILVGFLAASIGILISEAARADKEYEIREYCPH